MKYEKYSKKYFENCASKIETSNLLRDLDSDIALELKSTIAKKMEEIVSKLNQQGHSLKQNVDIEDFDETDFCEHHDDEESCGFRVGSTTTVSSGYYGVSELDSESEQ